MALSLADLDKEPAQQQQSGGTGDNDQNQQQQSGGTGIQGGDGTTKPPDLQQQQQNDQNQQQQSQQQQKPADGDDDDNQDDGPVGSIWDDVDALRGEKLDIPWEDEQGVIPEDERDTPRGILARERYVEQRAVDSFERHLMETDPRGYQYLLHRKAGGTDEAFFGTKTISLPDYDTFKDSVDLQVKVYADSLRNAGLSDKAIKAETDRAVKDKEIFELSDAAYRKQRADEEKSIKDLNAKLEQDRQYYQQQANGLIKVLQEQIVDKTMNFIVPEAKRPEFLKFLYQNIEYDDKTKQFLWVQPIDARKLPRQLEAMFLQFSGGDLGGIIQREAQSQNTRRLRQQVDKSKQRQPNHSDDRPNKRTLGEL